MIDQDKKNELLSGEKREKTATAVGPLTKRYYRVDEVAAYFAVSVRTIYRMIYDGEIKTIRIRGLIRISVEELRAFEERAIAIGDEF